MLKIKKILLPVDFPNTSLPVIHQAATLAHHFRSEIVMLHVVTAQSHAAGVPEDGPRFAGWDLLAAIVKGAEKNRDEALASELQGLTIRCVLAKGDPARGDSADGSGRKSRSDHDAVPWVHVQPAFCWARRQRKFYMAPSARFGPVPTWRYRRARICHPKHSVFGRSRSAQSASLRGPRRWPAEFGARLTLAHVTASVETLGSGRNYANPKWKEELVSDASQHLAELQQDLGMKADVFIGSGDLPKVLSQAAKQTKADLLVAGATPMADLRIHGYAIICAVPIPVLSV